MLRIMIPITLRISGDSTRNLFPLERPTISDETVDHDRDDRAGGLGTFSTTFSDCARYSQRVEFCLFF